MAPLQVAHSGVSDTSATVEISGVGLSAKRLSVYHLSDSHVTLDVQSWRDERRSMGLPSDDPIAAAYSSPKYNAASLFESQVAEAVEAGADILVHTGDLLNIPCRETVDFLKGVLERSGLPFLFTCGNHDWCYEGLGGDRRSMTSKEGRSAVREEWRERRLLPLFCGRDPHMWSAELGGILWVAIDNSTCQVSREQRLFFESAMATSLLPVVLLVHVPLASQGLKQGMHASGCGVHAAQPNLIENGFLCGDVHAPPHDPDLRPDAETVAFIAAAKAATNLAAVLSGHIHSAQVQQFGATGAPQLVASAGVEAGHRLITFRWDATPGGRL